jgi:hypothetical protein
MHRSQATEMRTGLYVAASMAIRPYLESRGWRRAQLFRPVMAEFEQDADRSAGADNS